MFRSFFATFNESGLHFGLLPLDITSIFHLDYKNEPLLLAENNFYQFDLYQSHDYTKKKVQH